MNRDANNSIIEIFQAFEDRIRNLLTISTLAFVTDISTDTKTLTVQPIPQIKHSDGSYSTPAVINNIRYCANLEKYLEVGAIVVVLFLDRDWTYNMNIIQKLKKENKPLVCERTGLGDIRGIKNGIVIQVLEGKEVSETYSKTEIDTMFDNLLGGGEVSETYSKAEIDAMFDNLLGGEY